MQDFASQYLVGSKALECDIAATAATLRWDACSARGSVANPARRLKTMETSMGGAKSMTTSQCGGWMAATLHVAVHRLALLEVHSLLRAQRSRSDRSRLLYLDRERELVVDSRLRLFLRRMVPWWVTVYTHWR